MFEKLFKLSEKNTNVKTEVIAGITTFLAMAYILGVNPAILGDAGMDTTSVFVATALSAGIASILMGVLANYPVSLAAGMGVNALFAYTLCGAMGMSWKGALCAVFVSGVIFLLISVTNIRKIIINSIPNQLKKAIGAGIGFFVAFVGFKNAGIIVASESTAVAFGNVGDATVLLALLGILITLALVVKKVPASVFVGMVITAIIGLVLGAFGVEGMPQLPSKLIETSFELEGVMAFTQGFSELAANPLNTFIAIFSLLFVDFFDTAGTLVAVGGRVGLIKEDGELVDAEKALLADSIGTVIGSMLGTSTVTSFVESSSGVEAGGKTGLTACVTGVLFIIAVLFAPIILSLVTNAVTAPALVIVGISMASQLKEIEWDNIVFASSTFVTVIMMVLTYSIANGIAFGFITYVVAMVASGKAKEVHPTIWVLMVIFVAYFALPVLG